MFGFVNNRDKENRKFTLPEGFLIALFLSLAGLVLDVFLSPVDTIMPVFPGNLIILICLIISIGVAGVLLHRNRLFWLFSSVNSAVPAIVLFTTLIVFIGLFPQVQAGATGKIPWVHNIKHSWTFYLSGLFVVVVLMAATAKRMKRFNLRNVSFVLNHLGLIILLLGAGFGVSDYEELTMNLQLNKPVWYATNRQNEIVELDFALEMQEFVLEYHMPLIKIDAETWRRFQLVELDSANMPQYLPCDNGAISIIDYCLECVPHDEEYTYFPFAGSVSAVKIQWISKSLSCDSVFWISTGSEMFAPEFFDKYGTQISILPPSPKYFTTKARVYPKYGENFNLSVNVNKPAKIGAYKIYQQSYDVSKGKYSEVSVLNLVKDPWLPIVYSGIFMLLAGAILLFAFGRNNARIK